MLTEVSNSCPHVYGRNESHPISRRPNYYVWALLYFILYFLFFWPGKILQFVDVIIENISHCDLIQNQFTNQFICRVDGAIVDKHQRVIKRKTIQEIINLHTSQPTSFSINGHMLIWPLQIVPTITLLRILFENLTWKR